MAITEELFEIGSPLIIGESISEGSGNAEKLFATFNILVGFPIFFSSDLNQLRIVSQRAIYKHVISSKLS